MTDHIGDWQRKTTANDIANQRATLWRSAPADNNSVITKARTYRHDGEWDSPRRRLTLLNRKPDYCELLVRPPSPSIRERISRSHWASRMRFT
jgi:hypothetical protein